MTPDLTEVWQGIVTVLIGAAVAYARRTKKEAESARDEAATMKVHFAEETVPRILREKQEEIDRLLTIVVAQGQATERIASTLERLALRIEAGERATYEILAKILDRLDH